MFETSNKIRGKHSNIKDFLVLRAQVPLKITPQTDDDEGNENDNNTLYFIPDPIFVYANLNEINVQVIEPLLDWLTYAPRRGDTSELLNLLVLDMLEDIPGGGGGGGDPTEKAATTTSIRSHSTTTNRRDYTNIESASSSSVHVRQKTIVTRQKPLDISKQNRYLFARFT